MSKMTQVYLIPIDIQSYPYYNVQFILWNMIFISSTIDISQTNLW